MDFARIRSDVEVAGERAARAVDRDLTFSRGEVVRNFVRSRTGTRGEVCRCTVFCEPGDLAFAGLVDVDVAIGLVDRHTRGFAKGCIGQVRGYHRSVRGQFGGFPFARVNRGDEVRVAAGRDHVQVGLVGRTFATVELLGTEEVEGPGTRGHPGPAREREGIALPVTGVRIPGIGGSRRRAGVVVRRTAIGGGRQQARRRGGSVRGDFDLEDVGAFVSVPGQVVLRREEDPRAVGGHAIEEDRAGRQLH